MTIGEYLETWPKVIAYRGETWALYATEAWASRIKIFLRRVTLGQPYLLEPHAPIGPMGFPMSDVITPETVYEECVEVAWGDDAAPWMVTANIPAASATERQNNG